MRLLALDTLEEASMHQLLQKPTGLACHLHRLLNSPPFYLYDLSIFLHYLLVASEQSEHSSDTILDIDSGIYFHFYVSRCHTKTRAA